MGLTQNNSGSQPAAQARALHSGCHCWLAQQCPSLAYTLLITLLTNIPTVHAQPTNDPLPTVEEMIAARTDVWGDAARAQPNGASYEFFKDLLPPLRWVNTDFRHYPIVLSAPRAAQKVRFVSNGSAVNARANHPPMWSEQGISVSFYAGDPAKPFGADLTKLEGPTYLDGHSPVVGLTYRSGNTVYKVEAFAPYDSDSAKSGTSFVQFSLPNSGPASGVVEARIGSKELPRATDIALVDKKMQCCVSFSPAWKWDDNRKVLVAKLTGKQSAELVIFTKPVEKAFRINPGSFERARDRCIDQWRQLLADGASIVTPEPIVNDAWRSMLIGICMTAVDDRLHYSAGNAYAKLYEGECGDVLRCSCCSATSTTPPRCSSRCWSSIGKDTRFHVAGHKLQLLAYFYWMTRDANTVRDYEPLWRPPVDLILTSRETRYRPAAEGPLRRRHPRAGLLAQLERQLLARPSRRGRDARRHGLERRG